MKKFQLVYDSIYVHLMVYCMTDWACTMLSLKVNKMPSKVVMLLFNLAEAPTVVFQYHCELRQYPMNL